MLLPLVSIVIGEWLSRVTSGLVDQGVPYGRRVHKLKWLMMLLLVDRLRLTFNLSLALWTLLVAVCEVLGLLLRLLAWSEKGLLMCLSLR